MHDTRSGSDWELTDCVFVCVSVHEWMSVCACVSVCVCVCVVSAALWFFCDLVIISYWNMIHWEKTICSKAVIIIYIQIWSKCPPQIYWYKNKIINVLRYDRQPRTLSEMIITNLICPAQCWLHGYGLDIQYILLSWVSSSETYWIMNIEF